MRTSMAMISKLPEGRMLAPCAGCDDYFAPVTVPFAVLSVDGGDGDRFLSGAYTTLEEAETEAKGMSEMFPDSKPVIETDFVSYHGEFTIGIGSCWYPEAAKDFADFIKMGTLPTHFPKGYTLPQ